MLAALKIIIINKERKKREGRKKKKEEAVSLGETIPVGEKYGRALPVSRSLRPGSAAPVAWRGFRPPPRPPLGHAVPSRGGAGTRTPSPTPTSIWDAPQDVRGAARVGLFIFRWARFILIGNPQDWLRCIRTVAMGREGWRLGGAPRAAAGRPTEPVRGWRGITVCCVL